MSYRLLRSHGQRITLTNKAKQTDHDTGDTTWRVVESFTTRGLLDQYRSHLANESRQKDSYHLEQHVVIKLETAPPFEVSLRTELCVNDTKYDVVDVNLETFTILAKRGTQ